MAVTIEIRGAEAIALVAAACRASGSDRKIVNDMAKEIRAAVPPIRSAVKASAVSILPHGGGLGSWVARTSITGVVRRGANTAGVTLRGRKGGSDMKAIDDGQVRHPTWGHRPWVAQSVPAGFFTKPATKVGGPVLEVAVLAAADRAAVRILNGG